MPSNRVVKCKARRNYGTRCNLPRKHLETKKHQGRETVNRGGNRTTKSVKWTEV